MEIKCSFGKNSDSTVQVAKDAQIYMFKRQPPAQIAENAQI